MYRIEKDKFSIIIPCYNSEKYLKRLLESIKKQTYKNIEVILIDDGSNDNTIAIMKEYEEKLALEGFSVKIKQQDNKGLGGAINSGLKLVSGEFFSWINSNDIIVDNYVEKYIEMFRKNPECNVVQRNGYMVPENEVNMIGKKKFRLINDWNTNPYEENLFMNMLLEVNYNFTYVALRTIAFDKVVNNREIYESREGQHWQLLLPMFYNYKSKYINEPGIYFIERKNSLLRNYKYKNVGKRFEMFDEYKNIIMTTLKSMNIDNYDYYEKLIYQKYIMKKLEYSKLINNQYCIEYYEKEYVENILRDNIYEREIEKILKQKPLVSIIIPVYNGSNYLKEAIDCAINQDYENIEIIVVNDGSNDGGKTEKIALSYGNKIRYLSQKNGGVSTALNHGISEMKGDFFSWLSHDDKYYNNKISTQMNYLINNNLLNKKVITYTNYDVIDENGKVKSETRFEVYDPNNNPEAALLRGLVSGTALLIPKTAFEEYGVFDTKYRCIQDYLLFFQFMKTYRYIHIPRVTNSTRVHSGQVTRVNPKVIEENNYLWKLMQEETSDETKKKLSGSIYDFYLETEDFLRQIADESGNNYVEARKYSLNKAKEKYESGKKIMKLIERKYSEEKFVNELLTYFNREKWLPNIEGIYCRGSKEKNKEIKNLIEVSGIYNVAHFAYTDDNYKKYKWIYYMMMNMIAERKTYYDKQNVSVCKKLMMYVKCNGIKKTIKNCIIGIRNKIRSNFVYRFIKRFIKFILKIILFIPKKIIQFILNI